MFAINTCHDSIPVSQRTTYAVVESQKSFVVGFALQTLSFAKA